MSLVRHNFIHSKKSTFGKGMTDTTGGYGCEAGCCNSPGGNAEGVTEGSGRAWRVGDMTFETCEVASANFDRLEFRE